MIDLNDITVDHVILRGIITDDDYMRRVLPFIKPTYFDGVYKKAFDELCKYVDKYNKLPTLEAFKIQVETSPKVTDNDYEEIVSVLPKLYEKPPLDNVWLINTTEKWCQEKAVHNALMRSISIIDGNDSKLSKNSIPDILQEALSVSFDTAIGHDYFDDVKSRYEFYHKQEDKIKFDIEYFNIITKGGLENKTLNIFLAGTGVGKSLLMCHCAANALMQGYTVLYITLEMAEERIAERIDANLLDIPIDQIQNLSEQMFETKVQNLNKRGKGRLIVKEYPTSAAHAGHFRALLNELRLKRNIVPDMIFIDYINICASSRIKTMGGSVNSYTYIKAIAEELRGLAVEFNVPIVSATQTNRTGFTNSDPGLEDTAESFGLPATADLMCALITSEELEQQGCIMVKQLKNRYNDLNYKKRFLIGVDKTKMRLYNIQNGEDNVVKDQVVMDVNSEKFKDFVID